MAYRDRQGLSPSGDPNQSSKNRDRYLDNCFLLCINRDDDADIPEIHRLENNLMRELCNKNPLNQIKSQQQQQQRIQTLEDYDFDDEDIISPRQQKDRDYIFRRKGNQQDRDSQIIKNRSRYQQDDDFENYYNPDQYSRTARFNHRDDYNIMQHSDDELSVYEVYVPTNTLNRLSDKRIDNNMVLIDYEDVSTLRDIRGPSSPYGYSKRNISSQYNNYVPLNQYSNYGPQYQYDLPSGFTRERDDQQQIYQNNPLQQQQQQQQQRFGGYYGNEGDRQPYSQQSGPFLPTNITIDHSNAINVRRHIYSPSQLPQGLTEGQLVMLLQKGSQYQQIKSRPIGQQTQPFPTENEPQPTTASAVTVSQQRSSVPSTYIEPFQNPEYAVPLSQIKMAQVPPQIIDYPLVDDEKNSDVDEIIKPMSTLNTTTSIKPSKDIEFKENEEKKKDKKTEKDIGDSSKKDSKKEKSSGKDGKKKKK